ncbi:Lamin Tail Domain [Lutibacter agarilyticus]|uniref:Lamin Tail Domain n=1 Tax=Lutibacter agarilyticus TaxID=1109740 RepID=A0A238VVZ0_9FLAO|nr:lamin tail domain-containing protein [Lutibacter agarilyticus]SNR38446.1 Lamin Tail Domain [Lutibacter agarilyticus]
MKNKLYIGLFAIVFAIGCSSEISFDEPIIPPEVGISDMIISEISTGVNTDDGDRNHYVELYNGTPDVVDLSEYAIGYHAVFDEDTLTDWDFSDENNFLLFDALLEANTAYVIASPIANATKVPSDIEWGTTSSANANASIPLQLSGNSAIALLKKDTEGAYTLSGTAYSIIDVFGDPNVARITASGSSSSRNNFNWTVAGETNVRNRTFWRKSDTKEPTTDWVTSKGEDPVSSQWILTDDRAWDYSNVGLFTGF